MTYKIHLGLKTILKRENWAIEAWSLLEQENEYVSTYETFESSCFYSDLNDLYDFLTGEDYKDTVYIATYSVTKVKHYDDINLNVINSNIVPLISHDLSDLKIIFSRAQVRSENMSIDFYIQEYNSYEDAYKVALDMMEGNKLCYD